MATEAKFNRRQKTIVVAGRGGFLQPQEGLFLAPLAATGDVSLVSLHRALSDYAAASGVHDPMVMFAGDSLAAFNSFSAATATAARLGAGELLLSVTAEFDDEPGNTDGLRFALERFAAAHRAELLEVRASVAGFYTLEATCTFPLRGRTIYMLHSFGEEIEALMLAASDQGRLTLGTARTLLEGAHWEAFVGLPEGPWIDAKRVPYRLDEPGQDFELAQDVASFANAAGGLIVIGMKTKGQPAGDVIRTVNRCRLGDVSARRYRGIIDRLVHPHIDGLEIRTVRAPTDPGGAGVAFIFIPTQATGRKPFVVSGASVGAKVSATFVSIPRRSGEDTVTLSAPAIQERLRAGELTLAHQQTTEQIAAVKSDLHALKEASVPDWLRSVTEKATDAGITCEMRGRSMVFTGPGRRTVVISAEAGGPLLDNLQRQRLLEQLGQLGLPTHTTPGGWLSPG
jgi:hypothetical protein